MGYHNFWIFKEDFGAMKAFKRALALAAAGALAIGVTSCGENTANAMTIDGRDVRAGIYLYYTISAYSDAMSTLSDGGEEFENCETTQDVKKIMKKANIDNVSAQEWIQNKAVEYCANYVEIEREYEELGFELTQDEQKQIEANAAASLETFGDFFKKTGIGQQSLEDIMASSYKQEAIWEYYYGEDGEKDIKDEELYDHYAENHLRIKYIEMPLKDGEGNLLKADGKEEIKEMAEDYLTRLDRKKGNEADLMEEFDFLIDEHSAYVTSLSNAAVTTTDASGNTVTTPTTAKITTDENGETGTTETTTQETTEVTGGTTQTTGTETTETTTETTTTTNALGYDTAKERILAVSTTGTPEAEGAEETTTTEPTYTPCEKVYNWAADDDTELLKPELIEDDECYYIVIKMDIEDRMTDDDLWSDSAKESVRSELYNQEFLDSINDAADKLTVERNEKAFRRYKVLDVDVVEYQNLLYQSYSNMYGGYGG